MISGSQYIRHMADIMEICRGVLKVARHILAGIKGKVTFATFLQQRRNDTCYLDYLVTVRLYVPFFL